MQMLKKLFGLDQKTIVVNGGAGRIGNKLCEIVAGAGANVALLDLNQEHGLEIVKNLRHHGYSAEFFHADTTDRDSLECARGEIEKKWGIATGLVNAIQYRGPGFYGSEPEHVPIEAWQQVMNVNLTGTFLACQVFGAQMRTIGQGSIVNVSSTYGVVSADPRIYGDSGVNSPISYAASKAAILNLSRYLAIHWRENGVRVNTLVPGGVFDKQSDEFVSNYVQRTPLGRMANAEDYNGAVIFMLSNASAYMTGSTVTVDGGWTAW